MDGCFQKHPRGFQKFVHFWGLHLDYSAWGPTSGSPSVRTFFYMGPCAAASQQDL